MDVLLSLVQWRGMRTLRFLVLLVFLAGMAKAALTGQEADPAGQQAAGIVSGVEQGGVGKIIFNETSGRLEVRDEAGILVEEIAAGSAGHVVDVYGQEFRLSFGKDEMGRKSVLVRAGPAMRKPVTVDVFGRKAVLSPDASLLATLGPEREVYYEASLCGQVYYVESVPGTGSSVSRLASAKREVAVLAKTSNPTGAGPGVNSSAQEDGKGMEKAKPLDGSLPDSARGEKAVRAYRK